MKVKNIAVKRAKNMEGKEDLHPEFIVYYICSDSLPTNFNLEDEGFELLSEEQFKVQIELNESFRIAEEVGISDAPKAQSIQDQQLKALFEEFQEYKRNKERVN